MSEVLNLGGRIYAPAEETTFAQDAAFMALLYETGVHQQIADGGDVLAAVLSSGRVEDFLAFALVPVGSAWSKAAAADTAAHFSGLTSREDKQQLMNALSVVVVGFLGAATPSATSSPNSSVDAPAAVEGRRKRRAKPSGSPSSEPSPITTEPVSAM